MKMIEIHDGPVPKEVFFGNYVKNGKPVLMKGALRSWKASKDWDLGYFKNLDYAKKLKVKYGNVDAGKTKTVSMGEYVEMLEEHERSKQSGSLPPYLHDVAIFHVYPELINDVAPFSEDYFSSFYKDRWWSYVQFFMSIKGHVTPLHFDTLMTNNTFYQIKGTKRFTLISWEQRENCYMKGWRWAEVNPAKPDLDKFKKFSSVSPITVDVEEGDILFMPCGTLHYVETLSYSISFNIDWHSKASVMKGLQSLVLGAPRKNIYYNFLIFLGLVFGIPEKFIYARYKSYLGYIT